MLSTLVLARGLEGQLESVRARSVGGSASREEGKVRLRDEEATEEGLEAPKGGWENDDVA